MPSHDVLTGRLVIPYINHAGVIGLTGRCIAGHNCKMENCRKYMQLPNQPTFLFNSKVLDDPSSKVIHICEGELDTVILADALKQPVVGVPGGDKWEPHWVAHFRGFNTVMLWQDGDKAGRAMASTWVRKIACEVVSLPSGMDVNQIYLNEGVAGLQRLAGDNDDDDDD